MLIKHGMYISNILYFQRMTINFSRSSYKNYNINQASMTKSCRYQLETVGPSIIKLQQIENMIVNEKIKKLDGSVKYRKYLKLEKLGKGGFADCYLVERMEDKKKMAMKIIPKKVLQKPKAKQKMISEITIHRSCKHKHICTLEHAFEDEEHIYMLLQHCSNGSMFELIRRRKRLTVEQVQYYTLQLIDALCYLHSRQIIHRDIKMGNLLINSKMQLKLGDFGLATKLQFQGDRKHTVCGTPNYIAPEIIKSSMDLGPSGHSYQVDIWSMGVIIYLMLVGRAPFETNSIERTYNLIAKGSFQFPQSFRNKKAIDLVKNILVVDVEKRYTFEKILAHPFMNPEGRIVNELPVSSLTMAPKFGKSNSKYNHQEQENIKQSARNASLMSIRSEIQNSLDEDFSGMSSAVQFSGSSILEDSNKPRSRQKSLLRSIFSTRSLSKSLDKLSKIGLSSASQTRTNCLMGCKSSLQNDTASSSSLQMSSLSSITPKKPQNCSYDYILDYRRQIILSYITSSGYIGTYEPFYKILYKKDEKLFFEIEGDGEPKKLKGEYALKNEEIGNRMKFISNFTNVDVNCEQGGLVYLKKYLQVKSESIIMFKLSNNNIQVHNYQQNTNLLITSTEAVLLELRNCKEYSRVVEKRDKVSNCKNKTLFDLYFKFKDIERKNNKQKKK